MIDDPSNPTILPGLEKGILLGRLLDEGAYQGAPQRTAPSPDLMNEIGGTLPGQMGGARGNAMQLRSSGGGRTSRAGTTENMGRGGGDDMYQALHQVSQPGIPGAPASAMQRGLSSSGQRADLDRADPQPRFRLGV